MTGGPQAGRRTTLPGSAPDVAATAAAFVFALAFWFAANPYIGVDHDARIYTLQALHWLAPEAYAKDLWFRFGSQDDWSLFSPWLALFLKTFGIAHGVLAATVVQALLFAAAALALGRALLGPAAGTLAGLVLAAIPLLYSPNNMLYATEGFVTARGLAIPLGLLALAAALRARRLPAAALGALALALHPIMALAPATLTALTLAGRRWQRPLLLAGAGGATLLFAAGAAGWLPRIDGAWRHYVAPAPLVFIDAWIGAALPGILAQFGVIAAASLYADASRRRFYALVCIVGLLAVGASWLAALLPVALLLKAQFWRALWFVGMVTMIAAVDLAHEHLLRRDAAQRPAKLLLALSALLLLALQPLFFVACVPLPRLLPRHLLDRAAVLAGARPALAWGAAAALAALLLPHYYYVVAARSATLSVTVPVPADDFLAGFLRSGGYGLTALLAWVLLRRWRPLPALLAALAALTLATVFWDARAPVQREREASYALPHAGILDTLIAPGATVYWTFDPERVWFGLGRSSYASTTQAVGLVFSEGRTLALARRLRRVVVAHAPGAGCDASDAAVERRFAAYAPRLASLHEEVLASYELAMGAAIDTDGMKLLCADDDLDAVVARDELAALRPRRLPREFAVGMERPLFVYDCKPVRGIASCPRP